MAHRHTVSDINRAAFDDDAHEYDSSIFSESRHYKEVHEIVFGLLAFSDVGSGPVLELGTGTANLTVDILERFPTMEVQGYDISEGMLSEARRKLHHFGDRVTLTAMDLTQELPDRKYKAIVSAYVIHHLSSRRRQRLFQRLLPLLEPGGCIIIADLVDPDTEGLGKLYDALARQDAEAQGLDMGKYDEEMTHGHRMASATTNFLRYVRWLRKAGYDDVDCVWKRLGLAVFYGRAPS